jgi:predicted nucleic acid-binding protein
MATLTAAYYYTQYVETRKTFEELKSLVIDANVLMNYGNGTQSWRNETVMAGSTAFDALLAVTKNVEYQTTAYGVFVTSINRVKNVAETLTSGHAWLWYYWNVTASKWTDLLKAADAYILKPNDSITWRYESYSYSF